MTQSGVISLLVLHFHPRALPPLPRRASLSFPAGETTLESTSIQWYLKLDVYCNPIFDARIILALLNHKFKILYLMLYLIANILLTPLGRNVGWQMLRKLHVVLRTVVALICKEKPKQLESKQTDNIKWKNTANGHTRKQVVGESPRKPSSYSPEPIWIPSEVTSGIYNVPRNFVGGGRSNATVPCSVWRDDKYLTAR